MKRVKDGYNDFYHEEDFKPSLKEENRTWKKYEVFVTDDKTNDLFQDFNTSNEAIEYAKSLESKGESVTVYKTVYSQYGEEDSEIIWEDGRDFVSDSRKIKDNNNGRKCLYFVDEDANAELTNRLLNGISHSLKDDPTTVDWVVEEMKKNHCEDFVGDWDDEPTTSMMSKDSEDGRYTMYWNDYGEIEIWGNENISDSRKNNKDMKQIKDGLSYTKLSLELYLEKQIGKWDINQVFDYLADRGFKIVRGAKPSQSLAQKETMLNMSDGDILVEMKFEPFRSNTKKLKGVWVHEGISDSLKIKDENTPDVFDGVLFVAFTDGTEDDMIAEVNKHANESDTIDGVQYETYETDSSDGVAMIDMCAATGDANGFVKALLNKWGIAENVADLEFEASDEMKEAVNDSKVSDMTKPVHLRGYAEKMRAKRRNKNADDESNTDEEKPNVSDSKTIKNNKDMKRVKDDASDTILHFHKGRGGRFYNAGHLTYEGVYDKGLADFAFTHGATEYDGYLIDEAGNYLGDARADDNVGILDWDGDYDTDYFVYLSEVEFDDRWYNAIISAIEKGNYVEREVEEYINSLEY